MGIKSSTGPYEPEDRYHEAIASFEQARDDGLSPDPAAWLDRYPDVALRLREYFADCARIEQQAEPLRPPPEVPAPAVKGYRILGPLGRGGMGMVYRAVQQGPDRIVALKVIRPDQLDGLPPEQRREAIQRFETEARAAARLGHENIVPVFEVGDVDGQPFYSMRYVEGASLADLIEDGPLQPRRAAAYLEQAALAVHEAHRHGILHRDLKPHNVLVEFATGRVFVADFGLAKLVQEGAEGTRTGAVMGTPPYMSPEQAQDSAHVTVASDVYSLGATLYALLTGRPPFPEKEPPAVKLRRVIEEEPVPPRRLRPEITRDLETVCLKCLHKDPKKRYAGAEELAGRLRLFLEGRPIPDRQMGKAERLWRWCRRNPAVAVLLGAVATALLLGTAVATSFALDAEEARKAEATRADAEARARKELADQLKRARHLLCTAQLLRVAGVMDRDPVLGLQLLCDWNACPTDLQDFAWHWYLNRCHRSKSYRLLSAGEVNSVAFSPDGKLLATGSGYRIGGVPFPGVVQVWDVATGRMKYTLKGHALTVNSVAFSPDGTLLASGGGDRESKGRPLPGLSLLPGQLNEGKPLLGELKVWDVAIGQEKYSLKGHRIQVNSVAFSPDGKLLASGGGDRFRGTPLPGEVKVWDVATGQEKYTVTGRTADVSSVAFSPDGKLLASGGGGGDDGMGRQIPGEVKVWDATTGQEKAAMAQRDKVQSVAFSPDGRLLASASGFRSEFPGGGSEGEVKVWDMATGREKTVLKDRTTGGNSIAFSRDGRLLALGDWSRPKNPGGFGESGQVKLWDLDSGQVKMILKGASGPVAFSPDSKLLASLQASRSSSEVNLWVMAASQEKVSLKLQTGPVMSVALSGDGRLLASSSIRMDREEKTVLDSEIKLWEAASGRWKNTLKVHADFVVRSMAFTGDGKLLASGSEPWDRKGNRLPGEVKVWDVTTGREKFTLKGHAGDVRLVAFSPDGKLLVSCSESFDSRGRSLAGEVKVWDVATGQEKCTLRGHDGGNHVASVAFSPDSKVLAASVDKYLSLWDVVTGEEKPRLKGNIAGTRFVAFSPDGRLLTWGNTESEGGIRLWDVDTGQEKAAFNNLSGAFLAFSPDGKLLALGSPDNTIRLCDMLTGQEKAVLTGHTGVVSSVAFSPDGLLTSASKAVSGEGGPIVLGGRIPDSLEVKLWDGTDPFARFRQR
jgi:WD40 repeat protein/predicted Ser/Thr protein kinase